jgi:N-acetylglucosaminyl-diphospho-decaprenol L-rhamnosyltransferase
MNEVCVSLVSHAQADLATRFLDDLGRYCPDIDLVVTSNIAEVSELDLNQWPRVTHLRNRVPKGFGANHNAAFKHCRARYFCVVNPDIRIHSNPFPDLLAVLQDTRVGVVAPKVVNASGGAEDSVRFFPTPLGILGKVLGIGGGRYPIKGAQPLPADWAAGMFLLFRAEAFDEIGGFDEDFFLYYEDVDVCERMWKAGRKVMIHPGISVVHEAQRASRKNWRYLLWHLSSMIRYFSKHFGRLSC